MPKDLVDLTAYDSFIAKLAVAVGLPFSHFNFIFLIMSTYPMAWLYTFINGKLKRHVYGIVIGLTVQYLMYREHVFIWWISQLGVYLSAVIFKRYSLLPIIISAGTGTIYINYLRYNDHYMDYRVEVETVMMMGAMKLVAFGFSLSDGYKDKKAVLEYLESISSNKK